MQQIAVKSGRGHGKTAAQQEMLAQSRLYVAQANTPPPTNMYADWLNEEWDRLVGAARFRSHVLGHWEPYTPRDELRDRLNDRQQGKESAPAVNTRYWRNL